MQSNISTKIDNCEVKFGELTRTVATKNVTISALVALFNIHNAQIFCYVVFPAHTVLQMKMDRFLNWKVSTLVELARSETRYEITNPLTKKALK